MKNRKSTMLNVRVTPEQKGALEETAKSEGRTMGAVLREIIESNKQTSTMIGQLKDATEQGKLDWMFEQKK